MKTMLLSLVAVAASVNVLCADDFGDRSQTVTAALQQQLKKNASEITAEDLASVTEVELPHIHIPAFKDDDFAGLKNLKRLHFQSLFHRVGKKIDSIPPPIGSKVFAKLSSLEELTIKAEQLGSKLPDDVFAGLTNLRVLRLTKVILPCLPKSMLTLPKVEAIYFDGTGMSPDDYATLKKTFGDKLKVEK
jgi:hypothetical protein